MMTLALLALVVAPILIAIIGHVTVARIERDTCRRYQDDEILSEHLRDKNERLLGLLNSCPVRMRHTLINGANITSERGR